MPPSESLGERMCSSPSRTLTTRSVRERLDTMPSVMLQPSAGETPHRTESLSTTEHRSSQARTAPTSSESGISLGPVRTRGMSARPISNRASLTSSSSYASDQTSSGQSRWHHGETSSRLNGIGPRGVESITTLLGSSSSSVTAAPMAEWRQGGDAPSIRTTLSGPEPEPSHQDPGGLHLSDRRACRWRMYGLAPMSSLSLSPPFLKGSVEASSSRAESPTGPSGMSSNCSSTHSKAFLRCGEA